MVRRQDLTQAARDLRKKPTTSEEILWPALRNRQMAGKKFRRQYRIGNFIVDFYCAEERLVVEIDGATHRFSLAKDRERQAVLEAGGRRVIRLPSELVERDITAALDVVARSLSQPSPPAPLPRCGRGVPAGGVRENESK